MRHLFIKYFDEKERFLTYKYIKKLIAQLTHIMQVNFFCDFYFTVYFCIYNINL
jgi:hypothetical protein